MKTSILNALLFSTLMFTTANAQDDADRNRLAQVLNSYYNIKNALVAGDNKVASKSATEYISQLNGISFKVISEGNVSTLLKDAATIADAKNIDKQRLAFANFSTNMAALARGLQLTSQPVYIQYCPMKKASWLSSEAAVRNPYYGNSMLTCGKVTETIQ